MADTAVPMSTAAPAMGGASDAAIDAAFAPDATSAPETVAEETVVEETQPELETVEEVSEDTEIVDDGQPLAEATTEKPIDETLPEGVTVRDGKGGKKEWVFPEGRGKTVYEGYKLKQLTEQLFGEDVTQESIEKRVRAHEGQAQLQAHFVSGQPEFQDRIISHFVRQGKAALERGEAAEDPMTSFSGRMPEVLLRENPDAFQAMRNEVLRFVLPGVIRQAANDPALKNLGLSAQHLQKYFFDKYDEFGAVSKTDDASARLAEVERRESELQRHYSARDAEQRAAWQTATRQSNLKSIEDAVAGVIPADVQQSFKKFPETYEALKDRLRSRAVEAIRADAAWQTQIKNLTERALLNRAEQPRVDIQKQLANMHRVKVTGVLESIASKVISEFTRYQVEKSGAIHARRAEAATRREPGSSGAPIQKSLVPPKPSGDGSNIHEEWGKALDGVFP
jgi:hypothetical protein